MQWSDVDLHMLCCFSKDGKDVFEIHDTKTSNGKRIIPLTSKAIMALKRQKAQEQQIVFERKEPPEDYDNLVFITKNNQPTQLFLIKECMDMIIKN